MVAMTFHVDNDPHLRTGQYIFLDLAKAMVRYGDLDILHCDV